MTLVPRRAIVVMGVFGVLIAFSFVLVAEGIARGVVAAIEGGSLQSAVMLLVGGGILRAGVSWASQAFAARAGIGAKQGIRRQLAARALRGRAGSVGSITAVGVLGLDELDAWYRTVLPAMTATATVPLVVGARILGVDWLSALIIALTVPLVPLFMVLVGQHTKQQSDAAATTLQRLSDHLAELARGLPVLVGLGRVAEQSAALRQISDAHRVTTMRTLRSAFLSSLVLELIATISVAIVAVAVGLRLLHTDLALEVGLVALILAPECFAPFRALGAAFHAASNGRAAMRSAAAIIDSAPAPVAQREGSTGAEHLTVRYRERDVFADLSFALPPGSITLVEGASGSGKSTLLAVLAGTAEASGGSLRGIDPQRVAYVPQHPHTVEATVRQELLLYGTGVDELMRRLRLPDVDPAQLSPGELRRLAVARGVLRVQAGATLLLLDEPTAHLDPASANLVVGEIERLRGSVTMVVASHESAVARLADRRIALGATTYRDEAADEEGRAGPTEHAPTQLEAELPRVSGARELVRFLRSAGWRFFGATLLGTSATLFAIALLAVSAWLIVRASQEPAIMYLLVAIVGVRFFGLGRAVLRYAERLLTHDAALHAVTELRLRLWTGLAALGPASRGLTTPGAALDYLVAATDRVRDLIPRVVLPIVTAVASVAAVLIAVTALHPNAVSALSALGVALVCAPAVALLADRHAARSEGRLRSLVLRRFAAIVTAAPDLSANGVGQRALDELSRLDDAAAVQARRGASALGLASAVVIASCALTSASMLGAAASAPAAVVAVLVLLPLGLIDPLLALVEAVQQWPALAAALRTVSGVTEAQAQPASRRSAVSRLELRNLEVTWPGATRPAVRDVSAVADRGEWIVIEGPSGSGKSTLLAAILGFVEPSAGAVLFDGGVHAARVAWCPQESYIFDSTVRANLLLARSREDRPLDDELHQALTRVGLKPLLDRLPRALDTRVGSEGGELSAGERQRLAVARALLTRADVVLLDEPTAHLDAEAARALMADLRVGLADRVVVLVTHHASEALPGDVRVRLGEVTRLVQT